MLTMSEPSPSSRDHLHRAFVDVSVVPKAYDLQ
jgi:hypothetical protein